MVKQHEIFGYPSVSLSTGSIPADAGLPDLVIRVIVIYGVYPRGCGATAVLFATLCLLEGLSPRMRGYRVKLLNG